MSKMQYKLEERPPGKLFWLSSMQWFVFMLANVITVPLVLGHTFGFTPAETAAFTGRTLLLCGLIGILQIFIGHRYPVIEGPAGMWWGVFLVLEQINRAGGGSTRDLLRELGFGLMAASLVFILLAVSGLFGKIMRLFTPAVTGTFLILLAVQVSGPMLRGMMGIGYEESERVIPWVSGLSLLLVLITLGFMLKGRGIWRNVSVLLGLAAGWILYALLGKVHAAPGAGSLMQLPEMLPYGSPSINVGIVVTSMMTAIILLSNLIASIQVFAEAAGRSPDSQTFARGSLVTGAGTLLAGLFGTVGAVPLTASASLVSITGIASRLPFLFASVGLVVLGLFPGVSRFFVTIPAPVGYAVLFAVFAQLLGFGLRDIRKLSLDQRSMFTVTLSLLAGIGLSFVPSGSWAGLPPLFGYLFGNGLIVGVVTVLVLEHIIFREKEGTNRVEPADEG